jgi:DNA-binding MarR family transcriptional regulator
VEETRWLTAQEQTGWRLYLRFQKMMNERLTEELTRLPSDVNPYGADKADYEILALLSEAPDRQLRMSELADVVVSPRSRLTYRIDQLVQHGLVERIKCDTDKRGAFAHLTESGWEALLRLAPSHVGGVRKYLFDVLTPEELDVMTQFLHRVVAVLDPHYEVIT